MKNPIEPIRLIPSIAPPLQANHHQFLRLLFLLSVAAAAPAQIKTDSSSPPSSVISPTPNTNSSMVIIIAVLFVAFIFLLSLSVYIRYCNPNAANSGPSNAAAPQQPSKRGLDPKVIESFPIFEYSDVKDLKYGEGGGGTLECAVCIAEFNNGDTLRLLPKCDHVFHPECIDAWLGAHSTCPVCRANLAPSHNELGKVTESTRLSASDGSQNQSRVETRISVDVEEGGSRGVVRPTRNLPKSHSTGHSLSQPGQDLDRYTLRLPVELRRELMNRSSGSIKRTISCVVELPTETSLRRGDGEGSSGGGPDQNGRPERWVFSMTPPFLSRARSIASPKVGFEEDLTAEKGDGVGQPSTRPPV